MTLTPFILGNDTLIGNGGNDTFVGGIGQDAMFGGAGDDLYFVDDAGDTTLENAGEGVDIVESSVSYALGADVEHLTLVGAAIAGTGNALANVITGNGADNILDGGAGSDFLNGGYGNDVYMPGFGGQDTVFDNGGDSDPIYPEISIPFRIAKMTLTPFIDMQDDSKLWKLS